MISNHCNDPTRSQLPPAHRQLLARCHLLAITLLLLISGPIKADGQAGAVVVVGDSISAAYGISESDGWVHLLQEALNVDYPEIVVHNASISGDTTAGGDQRLPRLLERISPDIVIIELGGNDGLRGQSLKQMASNLESMVDSAHSVGAEALILGMRIPSNYGPAYTEKFAAVFAQVATKTGAALVPFLLAPIAEDRKYFQTDGVHPTAEAQPLLLDIVMPELEKLLLEVSEAAK